MRTLKKQERIAIEAVARSVAAKIDKKSDLAHSSMTISGKRVAVDVAILKHRGARREHAAKPHLRFDKVVIRLMECLHATLDTSVPDGMTVLLTVTAPIRLPSKTALALEEKIQTLLMRRSGRNAKALIHGNRVRIRVLSHGSEFAPKMVGFVHNPDSDPLQLFNMTHELLEFFAAGIAPRTTEDASARWLVVKSARTSSCLEAYRNIYSELCITTGFQRILMLFSDGRIEMLAG